MARPWKRPKTGVYYLRKRVPLDLVAVVGRSVEKRTLGTKDAAEALFAVEARWRNLRVGLLRPTPREIAALAGEFYRAMTRDAEKGLCSPLGGPVMHMLADAFATASDDAAAHASFRQVFGSKIDAHLTGLGFRIDPDYAAAFDLGVARAIRDAQTKSVEIVFNGDASPDPAAARYPEIADALPLEYQIAGDPGEALRIGAQFQAYADATKIAASTRKRWGQALGHLPARLGHDDLRRITPDDVSDWIAHLRKEGLSQRTIRDVQLSALRALLGWLVDERKLKTNAATGFRIRVPKSAVLRSKGLTDAEAGKILAAALSPQPSRLSPKHAAARRWVPWLCAYTGARVNELTQMRAEDVFEADGIPVIRITPEAGSVKTGRFRVVPIHPHLIEQGFLKFARKRKSGPLFYEPNPKSKAVVPAYKKMGERLAAWVREIGVTDTGVDPNHGWRHRFKTIGRRARLRPEVLDAIQGHVPRTEGGAYGEFDPGTMLAEIVLIPRYDD